MRTPWGEIEVVDAHAHLFSYPFFQALSQQTRRPVSVEALVESLGWDIPPKAASELAGRWVEDLDRHGVARSVLMASMPNDEGSAAGAIAAFPDRFYGYFMFNPRLEDAPGRAARAFDHLGLSGLCLFPAMHEFSVQDETLTPVLELAAQRRVVVFVHMGVLTIGVRQKLGLPSRFDLAFSNPIDLYRVAVAHPQVQFVIPHFGAGFFREALILGDLVPNVSMDTSGTNSWVKYLVPSPSLADVFTRALEVYGPTRLLFGSDSSFFPRGWNRAIFEVQVEALRQAGVDAETARLILGENLKRLLGTP